MPAHRPLLLAACAMALAWRGLADPGAAGIAKPDYSWIGVDEIAPYDVIDGRRIEAPLGGRTGDAARGAALFGDLAAGGCVACHQIAGSPIARRAPERLRAAIPPPPAPPPPAPQDAAGPIAAPAGLDPGHAQTTAARREAEAMAASSLAPVAAPAPRRRPRDVAGAATGADGAAPDPAAPESPPESPPDPARGAQAPPDLNPILRPRGPALDGVAARLDIGALRLILVNPRLRDPASPMPAYYDVSLTQAERTPGLRQPWLSAQDIEDLVAFLATLDRPAAPAAGPSAAPSGSRDTGN